MDETPNAQAALMADDFEEANDEVIDFAGRCRDAQWSAVVSGEGWPVGVVLHHIATGHALMIEWLERARRGREITKTAEEIDADNVAHARDFAGVTRAETVEELRRQGAALALVIRSLEADELATSVPFGPAGSVPVTTEALAAVSARHPRTHLTAARGAVEPATG